MATAPHLLWFSVTTRAGTILQYELPNNPDWFSRADWDHYRELADMAVSHGCSVAVADERILPEMNELI